VTSQQAEATLLLSFVFDQLPKDTVQRALDGLGLEVATAMNYSRPCFRLTDSAQCKRFLRSETIIKLNGRYVTPLLNLANNDCAHDEALTASVCLSH
jgi:hypothetical protein